MGMLLSFRPLKAAKPKTRSRPAQGATASIIIFPGIRYERQKVVERIGQILTKSDLPHAEPVQY
jgi:hypothetical protein